MKWIKASERLPEFEKDVHAKLGGKSIFGRFYELIGKKRFSVNDRYELDTFYVAEEHFHLIEWLDESQASDKDKEIERGQFWTDAMILEFAVRSHLPGRELTIEEFIKLKSENNL